jgi:hypothetical protein
MNTPNRAIELPKDLYDRLQAAAKAEKVDPITLIENLLQIKETPIAPLYRVYEQAIDMGVTDLAQNLDHYLYDLEKGQNNT